MLEKKSYRVERAAVQTAIPLSPSLIGSFNVTDYIANKIVCWLLLVVAVQV